MSRFSDHNPTPIPCMNRTPFPLLTGLILFALLTTDTSAQTPIWIDRSEVREVKVYLSGAMISRTASVVLKPGIQEVVIDHLSPYIDPSSITLKGSGDATLHAVRFQQNYLQESRKSNEVLSLEAQLDSLNLLLGKTKNRLAVNTETQNLLLANKSVGGSNTGLAADKLEQVVDYFNRKLTGLREEQLEVQQREKKLNEQVQRMQQQLNQLRQQQMQPTGNIIVRLDVRSAGQFGMDFSYFVGAGVSWIPSYDIRVKDVSSPVELIYKATVSQRTGEDWNQVRLSLHGNQPSSGSQRPTLFPWLLDFYMPPVVYKGSRNLDQGVPMAMPAMAEMGIKDKEIESLNVSGEQQQLSDVFTIETPYTIPSDGQEYQVDLQKHSLPALYRHIATPKLDADAFLVAKISGWESLSLLPGVARIYSEGTFTGEASIQPAVTGDTLELSLGRDKRITVKRQRLKDQSSQRVLGSSRERELAFDFQVKNARKDAINLILLDQIPVSKNKDIEVKTIELSGAKLNEETGEVSWELSIPAGQTVSRRFAFRVKHPKDKTVSGL